MALAIAPSGIYSWESGNNSFQVHPCMHILLSWFVYTTKIDQSYFKVSTCFEWCFRRYPKTHTAGLKCPSPASAASCEPIYSREFILTCTTSYPPMVSATRAETASKHLISLLKIASTSISADRLYVVQNCYEVHDAAHDLTSSASLAFAALASMASGITEEWW